ncbi:NFX1-type zinc finger-containing protein 1 [Mytilus edulis]|uniref:NFX1-type zinc finger-containing protein 1 n=1 Tax=Mytilus edulis TaxID=6550 RepID=A0A8S3QL76_MYTED|nr:NFX1-type zinc finger-containing protein 1 [Mytilus edulis]
MIVSSSIVNEEKTQNKEWFWEQYDEKEKSIFIKKIQDKLCCTQAMSIEGARSVSIPGSSSSRIDKTYRRRTFKKWHPHTTVSNQPDKSSNELAVKVTAVDNYQGEENEIILLSLVRSNIENKIGYLSESNRVCVALSRAKIGLYAIGNFELLKSKSKLWNGILRMQKGSNSFGTRLQLTCQNHKSSTDISQPNDFDLVADGGCQKSCSFRRKCGHFCSRKCHIDDPDHSEKTVQNNVTKVCPMGHRCMKSCHFPYLCGKCNEIVEKIIPKCQHKKR